jgi:hypothetical protein
MNSRKNEKMGSSDDKKAFNYITYIIQNEFGLDNLEEESVKKKQLEEIFKQNGTAAQLLNLVMQAFGVKWD